ncbi:unnamed protein product [Chrysoparadoxa australica]
MAAFGEGPNVDGDDLDIEVWDQETGKKLEEEINESLTSALDMIGVAHVSLLTLSEDEGKVEKDKIVSKQAEEMQGQPSGMVFSVPEARPLPKPVEPRIRIEHFSHKALDMTLSGRLVLLDGSCYLWIGVEGVPPEQGAVVAAFKTKYEETPVVSTLIGGDDATSASMAQRISQRTGQAVFASVNIPSEACQALPMMEQEACRLLGLNLPSDDQTTGQGAKEVAV